MSDTRLIVSMGKGLDRTGATGKAACRAVEDALANASLSLLETADLAPRVRATIGAPDPEAVDRTAIAALLPEGKHEIRVVAGGLRVSGTDAILAAAAVEVFLPPR